MLDHLHAPSKMVLDPPLSSARVSLIYPQMLKARELLGRSFQHQRHRGSVLEVRRVHLGFEHHPQRIYQHMAPSSAQFLRSIVSAHATDAGSLHRLRVEDG